MQFPGWQGDPPAPMSMQLWAYSFILKAGCRSAALLINTKL